MERTSRRDIISALTTGKGKTYGVKPTAFMFGNKRIVGSRIKFISIKEKGFTKIVDYRR
jgi:hypothetical protein